MAREADQDIIRAPLDHAYRSVRSGGGRARGGWQEHRELAEDRPRAERREDPALLEDLDTSFEDRGYAVRRVALFEERRAGCRLPHGDLSVELVQVLVNDESKRAHVSNCCWSLRVQARSPSVSMG